MCQSACTFGQTFWVCLCFWTRLTFESVSYVKQLSSLMWVNPIQSVKGLNRTKVWPFHEQGEIPAAWLPFNWDTEFFLPLNSNWNTGFSWVSSMSGSGPEPHHRLCWVSSLPTADLGACQPPQTCELISCDKSLYMYINTTQTCTHTYTHVHTCIHTCAHTHTHTPQTITQS